MFESLICLFQAKDFAGGDGSSGEALDATKWRVVTDDSTGVTTTACVQVIALHLGTDHDWLTECFLIRADELPFYIIGYPADIGNVSLFATDKREAVVSKDF